MKYLAALLLMLCLLNAGAQKLVKPKIVFHAVFGDSVLKESTYYKRNKNDSLQITTLKFYVSGIELMYQHKTVWKENNSYHLLDAFQPKSLTMLLTIPSVLKYDKIKFNLGVDSTASVSGAMGGDLDPTKGMHWAWQSGYINIKLEGNSNLCSVRNNEFQYHLGGYQFPYNNLHSVYMEMPLPVLNVELDIKKLALDLPLTQQHHIMSPGKEAMLLTETVANALKIKK